MATLKQTLDSLVVPAAFARHDSKADPGELFAWKSNTESLLNRLDSFDSSLLSISELAVVVRVLAPLTVIAKWSSPATRALATARLSSVPASYQLITHILTQLVKPLFSPAPHPRLHISTARVLPRPADVQDTYIEQPWKEHLGLDEVIRWCLLNTESSVYENAWPLFLPPVMSFLDDYQVPYKLLGVRLVSDLLTRVTPQLLLRTGVDTLIFDSLINSVSHLRDHSTPDLICSAVTTTLQLIDLITPSTLSPPSISLHDDESQDTPALKLMHTLSSTQSKLLSIRFSRLSILLSSSLLGTVVMYTPTFLSPTSGPSPDSFENSEHVHIDPHVSATLSQGTALPKSFNPTLIAAAQSLPSVLSALGIGSARFLKGVIPVLAEWLALPLPIVASEVGYDLDNKEEILSCDVGEVDHDLQFSSVDVTLHLASLSSLSILLQTCAPRMGGWSATIVDAIGRCWTACLNTEHQKRDDALVIECLSALKKQLKELAAQLSKVHPNVIKNEYTILLASNKAIFNGLIEGIC